MMKDVPLCGYQTSVFWVGSNLRVERSGKTRPGQEFNPPTTGVCGPRPKGIGVSRPDPGLTWSPDRSSGNGTSVVVRGRRPRDSLTNEKLHRWVEPTNLLSYSIGPPPSTGVSGGRTTCPRTTDTTTTLARGRGGTGVERPTHPNRYQSHLRGEPRGHLSRMPFTPTPF